MALAEPVALQRLNAVPPVNTGNVDRLRLLSFNIQVGIRTEKFSDYVTRGWRHVLPDMERSGNLDTIASLLTQYDVVALQEVDAGSLRSGFINQVEYLAHRADFPFWYSQLNRDLGKFAQHANGFLARQRPDAVEDHKLPGVIPGRGAIMVRYGRGPDPLILVMLHLSLGQRARMTQLAYVRDLIAPYRRVVVMGDLNNSLEQVLMQSPLKESGLVPAVAALAAPADQSTAAVAEPAFTELPSWPSWKPSVGLDHILVSPDIRVRQYQVLDACISDHLPVALEIDASQLPHVH